MKKTFFSVQIEGSEKPKFFVDKSNAEILGEPKSQKVDEAIFSEMLKNGEFEDRIPEAEIIDDQQTQTPPEAPQNAIQSTATIDEETKTILERLQQQLNAVIEENERLKKRPNFQKLIEINERKETVKSHILRFGEGKIKLENVKKQLNDYQEIDETEYVSLVFVSITRNTGEIKELCRISNVATLKAITTEAVNQIDTRLDKLEVEKKELESYL